MHSIYKYVSFRLFTRALYSRENTHFGNTVGIDTSRYVVHQKERPNDFSCYERWEKPKTPGETRTNVQIGIRYHKRHPFAGYKIVCYRTSSRYRQMKWCRCCRPSQAPQRAARWPADSCRPNGMICNRRWALEAWILPKSFRQSHSTEPPSSITMR